MNRYFLPVATLFTYVQILTSCGGVSVGTGNNSPNDVRPSGEVVSQQQFTSLNGKTVTGAALIFFNSGTYILRLEGISTPSETGLQIKVATSPNDAVPMIALRATSGSQNYTLGALSNNVSFSGVYIHSTIYNRDYGAALFLQ